MSPQAQPALSIPDLTTKIARRVNNRPCR